MDVATMQRLTCGQRVFARHQQINGLIEFRSARFVKLVEIPAQWNADGAGTRGHAAYTIAQVEDSQDTTLRWLVQASQLRSA